MKSLRFVAIFVLVSLLIFYVAAVFITATSSITKMSADVRTVVFGVWLAVVVIGCMAHFLEKSARTND